MQPTSVFAKAYFDGLHKSKYWEPVLEDSLNLIAKLPAIAAHIYRTTYHGESKAISADTSLDWAGNLSHMMGETRAPIGTDLQLCWAETWHLQLEPNRDHIRRFTYSTSTSCLLSWASVWLQFCYQ